MQVNRRWNLGSDICPLCLKEVEDWKHITLCTHEAMINEKKKVIAEFQTLLDRHRTYPPLSDFLIDYVTHNDYTTPIEPLLLKPKYTILMHEAYVSQSMIGWENFSRGILSSQWKRIQYRHLLDKEYKDIHAVDKWIRMVMKQLLEFHRSLWKIRCDIVATEKEQTYEGRQRQDTLQLCKYLNQDPESVPEEKRHLLEKQDKFFLKSPFDNVVMWRKKILSCINNASNEQNNQSISLKHNTQDLRRFCKVARKQKKKKKGKIRKQKRKSK